MPNELSEIKDSLKEMTALLQAFVLSEKQDEPERKVLAQSMAVSLDRISKSIPKTTSAAEFVNNFLAAIKGDPGEAGKTPEKGVDYFTPEEIDEIVSRIKDLIPFPEDGKTPEKGVDYFTAAEIEEFVKVVAARIPKPKDGDPGAPGKDAVIDYDVIVAKILPLLPKPKDIKPVTLDTPQELVKKLRSLKEGERLSLDDLKDVPDFAAMLNRAKQQSVKDPGITIESAGQEIAALISKINFTGSGVSVTKVGDRVIVQITGGGGSSNIAVQESLSDQTIDGVNAVFTLDFTPVAGTLQLFLNEALVSPSRYSLVGNQITFNAAPDASYSGLPFDAFYEKSA